VKISDNDTVMDLYWKTVEKGCGLLCSFFRRAQKADLKGFRQNSKLVTYFPPRTPKDGKIDWTQSAENVYNLVRALTYPYPGAYFYSQRKKLVVEDARAVQKGPSNAKLGIPVFYKGACLVKTGTGFLKIKQLRNRKLSEIKS
jgi:methionyl-tRNA formyltransferase